MKKNKKQRKVMLLLLVLLAVTVGFALLSVTLKINGTAGIKSNQWNIHWENVVVNEESTVEATTPVIDTNRTKVTYEVELELPGDYFEFTVDAKNDGTINGAIDAIRHNVYEADGETETTLPNYIKYSLTYEDGETTPVEGDVLESGEKQTYKIRIEYDSEATTLPATNLTYKIVDEIDYVQTKEEKDDTGFIINDDSTGPILGGLKFGDEVCIKNECFNVITSDNNTTTLLAKYNLLIGNICTDEDTCTPIPTTTEGYGIQNSTAIGLDYNSGNYVYPSKGTIAYAANNYWFGQVGEGKRYAGVVEASNEYYERYTSYVRIFDENSYLYSPLMNYLAYLKSISAPNETTINIPDANNLHTIAYGYQDTYNTDFLFTTNYWGGESVTEAYNDPDDESVYGTILAIYNSDWGFSGSYTFNNYRFGLRPMITLPTSLIGLKGWVFRNPGSTGINQHFEYWDKGQKIESGWADLKDFSNNQQRYYFENGYVKYGWLELEGNKYYLSESDADSNGYIDGNMVRGGTINIGGTDYTFDNDGVCTNCN